MKFNIWRYAVLTVGCKLPATHTFYSLVQGEVCVGPIGTGHYEAGGQQSTISLGAHTPHTGVLPIEGNEIVITPDLYNPLQCVIELFANLLAVQFRCKRWLSSPSLYAAIEPIDAPAKEWLRSFTHIKRSVPQGPARIWPRVDPDRHLDLLRDRVDGISLLAEALCHNHPNGRFHELMRVFERAFAAGPTAVCKRLLPAFLAPAGYGFTPAETDLWLNLRDRSVHADRRPDFALEAETYPVVNRVEQAAYDVLFNKAVWRTESTDRREVFHPWYASADRDGEVAVLYKGGDISIEMRALDGFGAYPFFLKKFGPKLPDGWVGVEDGDDEQPAKLTRGKLDVRDDPYTPAQAS